MPNENVFIQIVVIKPMQLLVLVYTVSGFACGSGIYAYLFARKTVYTFV